MMYMTTPVIKISDNEQQKRSNKSCGNAILGTCTWHCYSNNMDCSNMAYKSYLDRWVCTGYNILLAQNQ